MKEQILSRVLSLLGRAFSKDLNLLIRAAKPILEEYEFPNTEASELLHTLESAFTSSEILQALKG